MQKKNECKLFFSEQSQEAWVKREMRALKSANRKFKTHRIPGGPLPSVFAVTFLTPQAGDSLPQFLDAKGLAEC